MMTSSMKILLPVALLTATSLTGCYSETGEETPPPAVNAVAAEPAAMEPPVAEPPVAASADPAGTAAPAGSGDAAAPPLRKNPIEEMAKTINPAEVREAIEKNIAKLDEMVAKAGTEEGEKQVLDDLAKVLQAVGMMQGVAAYIPAEKRPEMASIIRDFSPHVQAAAEAVEANPELNPFILRRIQSVQRSLDAVLAIWDPQTDGESADEESGEDAGTEETTEVEEVEEVATDPAE